MSQKMSSIPTTVRSGLEMRGLPSRASELSAETLEIIFGAQGCTLRGRPCITNNQCCSGACARTSPIAPSGFCL